MPLTIYYIPSQCDVQQKTRLQRVYVNRLNKNVRETQPQ